MDFENSERPRFLLGGASGMLGNAIAKELSAQGFTSVPLLRREPFPSGLQAQSKSQDLQVHWDPASGELDPAKLDSISPFAAAIHLSGANVSSRRWTAAYKREIWESRVTTTHVLASALARMRQPPRVLLAASAVGLYGDRGDQILDENSVPGSGYFPELCTAWEAAAMPAAEAGIRVVHLRFGVVIGPDGGALAKLIPLFRLGLGGRLGHGRQWMSWVSERDVVGAALFALENLNLAGPLNVTSPNPVTNADFTQALGRAVHRPAVLPAPAFALRLAFGEMADEALLASTRAIPERLTQAGFAFTYPTLDGALTKAVGQA